MPFRTSPGLVLVGFGWFWLWCDFIPYFARYYDVSTILFLTLHFVYVLQKGPHHITFLPLISLPLCTLNASIGNSQP